MVRSWSRLSSASSRVPVQTTALPVRWTWLASWEARSNLWWQNFMSPSMTYAKVWSSSLRTMTAYGGWGLGLVRGLAGAFLGDSMIPLDELSLMTGLSPGRAAFYTPLPSHADPISRSFRRESGVG